MVTEAFKLFRVRADGSLGSLFIDRKARLPFGKRLAAATHPTKGFKVRAGWHACPRPKAPHLSTKGRAWYRVALENVATETRPAAQGGEWYLAQYMTIVGPV